MAKCINPNCGAIMLITGYKSYDNGYTIKTTCSVCRLIREQIIQIWPKQRQ